MATSPFVSPPLAAAGGAVSRRLAPTAPAPTAAPFSRNERRSVTRQDCSTFSMVFSFGSSDERRAAPLAVVRTPRCGVAEPSTTAVCYRAIWLADQRRVVRHLILLWDRSARTGSWPDRAQAPRAGRQLALRTPL